MRGQRPHNPQSDYIIIDEIYFYKEKKGRYYLGNVPSDDGKRKPVRAHIYVWEKYNGKIPEGFAIHHIDKNPRNNDISNLCLMSYSAHLSHHGKENADASRERMNEVLRPLAIEWHKSEDGVEWHKQHYEEVTRDIWNKKVTKICTVCGKEYEVVAACEKKSKYCSDYCKNRKPKTAEEKERNRIRGREFIDSHLEERVCQCCGKPFQAKKYYKTKCCSPACRNKSISLSKLELYGHLPKVD